MSAAGRHEAPERPPTHSSGLTGRVGFRAEVRDAVSPRTVALVVGVLFVQLAFILSYVGAFHAPKPHRIPVALVAPAQASAHLVPQLDALPGQPVAVTPYPDRDAATTAVRRAETSAALVVDPTGTTDTLLVASGGGSSVVTAVEEVARQVETQQGRALDVVDVVPLQPGDARGLTGFYLVVGWIVGGYLVAALLGVARGARPATTSRAVIRLLAVVPYAVLSGLGGALIVGPVLGALTGHVLALWGLGALVVFAAAAVTLAFQVLAGVLGIGLTVLLFVVLGNPTAGGAYQSPVLPPFWRALSSVLPNGAATDAVRRIVYFGGHGILAHLLVLAAWAVGGTVVAVLASLRHERAPSRELPERRADAVV